MLVAPVSTGMRSVGSKVDAPPVPPWPIERDHAIDPLPDRVRDLRGGRRSPTRRSTCSWSCCASAGRSRSEPDDLVDERRQRQVEELEEEQHRHDVHDDDRDAPAHATTSQPADRRVQQVDEQQPEHEGPDRIPRHPQQQPDEDRRADEYGDARGHRNESRVVAVGRGVDERGRGERGDPLRRRGGGRPLGLVHRSGRLADVSELPDAAAEPRQRWRLVVARELAASQMTQRDVAAAWTAALADAGLPLVEGGAVRGRSRLASVRRSPSGWPRNAN